MTRNIILIRYAGAPFKDHWAIFVPSVQNPSFGTLIQVEGDVRSGFRHDIRRNYNTKSTRRSCKLSQIGAVADKHVHDTPNSGNPILRATDTKDDIERAAMSVAAPGPSMNPTEGNTPPTRRVAFSDCQWWVRKVTEKLVADGILDQGAIGVLDALPKN